MGLWLAGGGLWLAGGGFEPTVKVGLGPDGFMAGWGWFLTDCEDWFGPGWVYGLLGVVFGPLWDIFVHVHHFITIDAFCTNLFKHKRCPMKDK
jgi:hypothetical protein